MEQNNQELVTCKNCEKIIATINDVEDRMEPSAEECYAAGNVPIPNLGWLCSQECAIEFEQRYNVKFDRTVNGNIDYYYEG